MLGSTVRNMLKSRCVSYTSILVAIVSSSACLMPKPDLPKVDQPDHYARGGVQFSYPSDWDLTERITEGDEGGEVRNVSVGRRGVGGAVVRVYSPPPPNLDLDAFVQTFSEAVKSRVPDGVSLLNVSQSEVDQFVGGEELRAVRKEFHLNFIFQRFSLLLDFHRIDADDQSAFLVTVLADSTSTTLVPALDLVRNSLQLHGVPELTGPNTAPSESPRNTAAP